MNELLPLCKCGCGSRVTKLENQFIRGHNPKTLGKRFSNMHKLAISKSQKKRYKDKKVRENTSIANLREKYPLPDEWEFDKDSKMVTNKDCANYLGCYIAESVLIKLFKNVKRMPNNNHGYDFICNNGYKIDVKSSATGYKGYWHFNINKNQIADYFIFLAFGSRNDLTPTHLWLIPGKDINHLTGVTLSKSTIGKWNRYEHPIDKVIACCNEMKHKKAYKVLN